MGMTQEPPRGMRANLLGSMGADPISDPDFYDGCSKTEAFHSLCYALCFFHALFKSGGSLDHWAGTYRMSSTSQTCVFRCDNCRCFWKKMMKRQSKRCATLSASA